ncbi:unnamed protein product [Cyclocybe aegerita]|uniref:Wax synthase domain-containing protein n=1 Tax=Cyclocybe aegerita TaxID=1973307 RepID=A0A8S0WWS6_CYCAE|nr:unnamed protein product [Cyclocybe aegerita]
MTTASTHSTAYAILTELLIALTIVNSPSKPIYRRLSFLPILALVCYQIFCTTIDINGRLSMTMAVGDWLFASLVFASHYLLLTDAQRDIWLVKEKHHPPVEERPILSRLWWAACLLYSPRAIGWSHSAAPTGKLPPRPTQQTKKSFAIAQMWYIVRCIAVCGVVISFARVNPYFDRRADPTQVRGYARLWRLGSVLYPVMICLSMSVHYTALSVVSVWSGMSEPQDWPRLFGSPWGMYTVRRVWGTEWHQLFRGVFTVHAEFLAKVLHLPPKSKITTYFKLFIVLTLSAFMHLVGDYAVFHGWTRSGALHTFILQAVAIVLEDRFLAMARKAGFKETQFSRCLGYVWVIVWFSFSLPYWIDPAVPVGSLEDHFPFMPNREALTI